MTLVSAPVPPRFFGRASLTRRFANFFKQSAQHRVGLFRGKQNARGLPQNDEAFVLLRDREFPSVYAEASSNAHDFYLRRGYRAAGPQTPDGAWPMVKEHLA